MAKNLWSRTGVPQPTNFVVPSWIQQVMQDFLVKQAEGGGCSQECSAFQPSPISTEARSPQHHPQQRVASTHGAASHSASFSSCLLCALNSLPGELLMLLFVSKCTRMSSLDLREQNRMNISYVGANGSTFPMVLSYCGMSPHPPYWTPGKLCLFHRLTFSW